MREGSIVYTLNYSLILTKTVNNNNYKPICVIIKSKENNQNSINMFYILDL